MTTVVPAIRSWMQRCSALTMNSTSMRLSDVGADKVDTTENECADERCRTVAPTTQGGRGDTVQDWRPHHDEVIEYRRAGSYAVPAPSLAGTAVRTLQELRTVNGTPAGRHTTGTGSGQPQ
jgi:hypothetical protein